MARLDLLHYIKRSLSIALFALLSGCAGVFNPYVAPDADKTIGAGQTNPGTSYTSIDGGKPSADNSQSSTRFDCSQLEDSLCSALTLAERYRVAYLKAAGNQQILRNTFAIAGLIAATSTLYYGLEARDKYRGRVVRLATVGAASYAAGSFFTSSPRQQVYLDGATAMSCAMIAAAPAMVPKSEKATLQQDLNTLQDKLRDINGAALATSDHLVLQAISDGESTLQSGTEMLVHLTTSGIVLRARIEVLANEVNHQTLAQLPDLNSLYSLAGSMSTFAQTFGSQRLTSTATKSGATASSLGGGKPSPGLIALQNATDQVKKHLKFAGIAAQTFSEVAACSPDGIVDSFSVGPLDTTVTVEKGKTYSFTVKDKRGHPKAKLSGANADKVELQPVQIQADDYLVVVKGIDATGTSGPSLLISESNGMQSHAATILVSAPSAKTDVTTAKPQAVATTPRNNTIDEAFLGDPLKILAVQCLVGAQPDCVMGAKTRAAIRAYKNEQKPRASNDDTIDAQLQSAAGKLNLPPTACRTTPISCKASP
jgi:hypothetical protein